MLIATKARHKDFPKETPLIRSLLRNQMVISLPLNIIPLLSNQS